MKTFSSIQPTLTKQLVLSFALLGGGAAVSAATLPAFAQETSSQTTVTTTKTYDTYEDVPLDDAMTPDERAHYLRGTVANFAPYRILLATSDEKTTQVDLDKGTAIMPEGTTITPGMKVAVHGSWSKGVFVADRVMLAHPAQ